MYLDNFYVMFPLINSDNRDNRYFLGNICIVFNGLCYVSYLLNSSISSVMQSSLFCFLQLGRLVVLLPSKFDHKYRLGKFCMLIFTCNYKLQLVLAIYLIYVTT